MELPFTIPTVSLTLRQPYASLVAIGAKRIETRSWRTRYRGPVVIHASKTFTPRERQLVVREPFLTVLREAGFLSVDDLPFGALVAVTSIDDCTPIAGEPERSFGRYAPGRYAWHLGRPFRLLTPIPARGALGFWKLSNDVPLQIREQLARL